VVRIRSEPFRPRALRINDNYVSPEAIKLGELEGSCDLPTKDSNMMA